MTGASQLFNGENVEMPEVRGADELDRMTYADNNSGFPNMDRSMYKRLLVCARCKRRNAAVGRYIGTTIRLLRLDWRGKKSPCLCSPMPTLLRHPSVRIGASAIGEDDAWFNG